jgi:nucleotide-binding universal stress UspA family protein
MIKTILVATDFSEHAQRALECASDLAGQVGAKLYLLHVQTEGALRTALKEGLLSATSTDEEISEAVEQLIEERFSQSLCGIDRSQNDVEHCSRRGEPGVLIPTYSEEIGADLVVLGRRGAGFIGEVRAAVIGSVTASVIRRSPCPVMVVRREHGRMGSGG